MLVDEDEVEIRDARRLEMKELVQQVPNVAQHDPLRALKMSERVLKLFKQDGQYIPVNTGTIHYDAFQVVMACNERKNAKYNIAQCVKMYKLCEGDGSPEMLKMQSKQKFC